MRVRALAAPLVVALGAGAGGCVDPLLAPEPGDDAVAVFDVFWSEIDGYYAYFAFKPDLDWRAVRAAYRPRVDAQTGSADLAQVLGEMIAELRDGHADLRTPHGSYGFDPFAGRATNHRPELVREAYLTDRRVFADGVYEAGRVAPDIGYVSVSTMGRDGSGRVIDDVLDHIGAVAALVVDVRSNGGGSDDVSEAIAARFADRRRLYRWFQYRDGPAYDDFGERIADYIQPDGSHRFAGPVALLTSRRTFSAAEGFVAAMRTVPQVVTIGDTTGGGAGNPIHRELPNGWTYRVPRWVVWTADELQYEGIGLAPDIALGDTDPELAAGRDVILERAIEELQARIAAARAGPGR